MHGGRATRYYKKFRPANNLPPGAGHRTVQEINNVTGAKRVWHETYYPSGKVKKIRPEKPWPDGKKRYYEFDEQGNYIGPKDIYP